VDLEIPTCHEKNDDKNGWSGHTALYLSSVDCRKEADVKKVEVILGSERCDYNKQFGPQSELFDGGLYDFTWTVFGCVSEGDNRDKVKLKVLQCLLRQKDIDIYAGRQCSVLDPLLCYCIHHWGVEEERFAGTVALEVLQHPRFDWETESLRNEPLLCLAARWGTPELVQYLLENEHVDANQRSAIRVNSGEDEDAEDADENSDMNAVDEDEGEHVESTEKNADKDEGEHVEPRIATSPTEGRG